MFDTVGFSLTIRNKTVYWEDLSRQMLVSILNGGDNWFQHPFITNIAKHRLRVCICSSSGDCAEVEVVFLINMSPLHSLMILGSCPPSPLSPGNTASWQNEEVSKPQLQKFFFNVYSYYSFCLLQSYIDSIPVKRLKRENKQFKNFFNYPFPYILSFPTW